MSIISRPRPLYRQRSIGATARVTLGRMLGWPIRFYRIRRTMNQLGQMTDDELRDIGLVRQDLRDVSALPPGEDPTPTLSHRARGRQRRR